MATKLFCDLCKKEIFKTPILDLDEPQTIEPEILEPEVIGDT